MKRTLIALFTILSITLSSCDTTGSSEYTYSSVYRFRPITKLSDTTFLNPNYGDKIDLNDAQLYVDTMLGRYFLNNNLLTNEEFQYVGKDPIDADTNIYNMIMAEFNRLLPIVEKIDYKEALQYIDTVYAGNVEITYEVVNAISGFEVIQDSITTVKIVRQLM